MMLSGIAKRVLAENFFLKVFETTIIDNTKYESFLLHLRSLLSGWKVDSKSSNSAFSTETKLYQHQHL